MKNYFGEFLVSRGVVSNDQLVEALIHQVESTQTLIKIVFDNDLLTSEQIMETVKIQVEDGVDFISALKSKNFLDTEKNRSAFKSAG